MSDIVRKVILAADHAGFALKSCIANFLRDEGHEVEDLGTHSEERVDYPDYADKLAKAIVAEPSAMGVGICGSGIGISIGLNRHAQIRAALCTDANMAELARKHNDANVLVLGARIINEDTALECARVFLNTEFEGGRHTGRVEKLGLCCK